MQRLIISGALASLNDYILACRGNKYAAAGLKKRTEARIMAEIEAAELKPVSVNRYPLTVKITWYEKDARRDADNIIFAKKFILDALVKAGILQNDSRRYICGFIEEVKTDKENPRIEITF